MENTNFWNGFIKHGKAKKAPKYYPDTFQQRRDKLEIAGAATGLAAAGGLHAGILTDTRLTEGEANKLVGDLSTHFKIPKPKIIEAPHELAAAYHGADHSIHVVKNPLQGIVSHEMGHASHAAPATGILSKLRRKNFGMYGISRLAYGAPGLALLSSNDDTRSMAAPASLALGAPVLIEEGIASAKALKAIHKLRGLRQALKSTPGLAGAFATYASVPGGIYLANKWINGKKQVKK